MTSILDLKNYSFLLSSSRMMMGDGEWKWKWGSEINKIFKEFFSVLITTAGLLTFFYSSHSRWWSFFLFFIVNTKETSKLLFFLLRCEIQARSVKKAQTIFFLSLMTFELLLISLPKHHHHQYQHHNTKFIYWEFKSSMNF
jgi:hypothetical protein